MRVAEAAIAACQQDKALARLSEISDQRLAVLIENLRPRRQFQHDVRALRPGAVLAHAIAALLGFEVLLVAEVEQRVEIGHAFHDHVAALAAVSAVGAAVLDKLLPPEAHAPVAAIAGADKDLCGIKKLHQKGLALEVLPLH